MYKHTAADILFSKLDTIIFIIYNKLIKKCDKEFLLWQQNNLK